MKAFRKVFVLAGYLALGLMASCEIEDEYSNPDQSEQLGTMVYTGNNPFDALLWSENTNEIIVMNRAGLVAIEAQSKKVRKLPYDASYFTTRAWVVGNTIYQLNTNGELSSVDLTTLNYIGTLVDSASIEPLSFPFSATHFAYAKPRPTDSHEPSIYLYDLESHEEIYVGTGFPYVFSPDGNQFIFSSNTKYFIYNLTTKTITSTFFNEDSGPYIIRWTTDGILFFYHQGESIIAMDAARYIGEWKSTEGFYGSIVSPSGKHITTMEYICMSQNTTGGYCHYGKMKHSIVDINNNVTVPTVYTVNSQIYLKAFSPDEKSFAFVTSDHNVYVSEPLN